MRDRYVRPDWVRRLNAMGAASGGAEVVVPLEAGPLLDEARRTTGIDDFGDVGDGDWEGRFRSLVDLAGASGLTVVGRLLTREELARSLRTRLFVAERRRQAPAIAEEVIEAPVVVTGPARSGTTILFELLDLDPTLRSPRATDALHPAPPAGTTEAELLAMAECEQELWADVQPEFAAMHELRSDLPVECITLDIPSFAGGHWGMFLGGAGWAMDVAAELAWHRAVLQTLQFGRPRRTWLLKTPAWVMLLDDLLQAYPDARIVQTHRDPAKTMPSTVSITAMVQWMRMDDVDVEGLSSLIGALFTDALAKVTRRRADGELPEGQFGDVRFHELLADPVAAVGGAFAQIGRPFTEAHAQAITAYLAAKPRGKFGAHRYTAEEWGFDPEALHHDLAEYLACFSIPIED